MKPKIEKSFPLADETTFKIGGPAQFFVPVYCKHQLEEVVKETQKMDVSVTILGGASNVLIPSDGVEGLVVKLRSGEISFLEESLLRVGAGVSLPRLSKFCFENSLKGLEWAMGVPGTLGGAVYGNAGAFGDSMADLIEEVEVLENGKKRVLKVEEINFSYRTSTFKENGSVILSAALRFKKGDKKKIEEKINKYLEIREGNHPMDKPSAGSVFKNPETKLENPELVEKFPLLKDFNRKEIIPAGYLIEKAGLKGKTIGKAKVSVKHANFIVNEGGADSEEVKELIDLIGREVKKEFDVDLKREIRYI